jgi:hypothetical protein
VCCLTAEPVAFDQVKSKGCITRVGAVNSQEARRNGRNGEVVICINPGGEETWDRLISAHSSPGSPFVVLNNAFSTTYNLGNKRGFEEAYYLKRISKGWVFRSFPGPWQALLEKPDGTVELLKTYAQKPELREIATLVREESFKASGTCLSSGLRTNSQNLTSNIIRLNEQRYAINNDRWTPGFGERL